MDELRLLILKLLVLTKLAELPEEERRKTTASTDHLREFAREVIVNVPAEFLAQATAELIANRVTELFNLTGRQFDRLQKRLESGEFDFTVEFPEIKLPEGIDLDQLISSILDGL